MQQHAIQHFLHTLCASWIWVIFPNLITADGLTVQVRQSFVEDTEETSGFDRNEDMLDMEEEVAKKTDELANVRVW